MNDQKKTVDEKNKKKKKEMKKSTIIAISAVCVTLAGFGGFLLGNNIGQKKASENVSFVGNIKKDDQGIEVKMAFVPSSDGTTYGTYQLSYSVNPVIYTDEIIAELHYVDGSDVPEDIMTLTHNQLKQTIIVECKKVFTTQIKLKIYAQSNTSISAETTFDFKEKLTISLPDYITISEGNIPTINPVIETTGGSVSADRTIKNAKYSWNSNFLEWIKSHAKAAVDSMVSQDAGSIEYEDIAFANYIGLDESDANTFFSTKFSANSFLTSKGCSYSFSYKYADDDDYSSTTMPWYLGSTKRSDFISYFDGNHPIFDIKCTINGSTFEKSYGLALDSINVTKLSFDNSGYVF